MEIVDVLSTSI